MYKLKGECNTQVERCIPLFMKRSIMAETWALADELGVLELIRTETLTCYNGVQGDGCGHCPACTLRREGLEKYLKSKNQ